MKQTKPDRKLRLDKTHVRLLTREQLVAAPGGFFTATTGGTINIGCAITLGCH